MGAGEALPDWGAAGEDGGSVEQEMEDAGEGSV